MPQKLVTEELKPENHDIHKIEMPSTTAPVSPHEKISMAANMIKILT